MNKWRKKRRRKKRKRKSWWKRGKEREEDAIENKWHDGTLALCDLV